MLRINSTLLTKLFTSPDPQPENPDILKIYNSLGTRIFPGKDDIILFLQSQSHDKQLELAEKIIHRLCFVSNFPPPYYAINDIISVEEYQKISVGEQDSYVPRDHFIHTLNLYLLGIYVFFYNSEFYRKISSNTRFERRNEIHNHPKIDSIKDFISEWKYFCLYHDIGYAPEIFGSKKFVQDSKKVYEELCNSKNIFFASLMRENTTKQIAFFSAIEIMSRCFVWKTIMNYSNERIPAKSKLLTTFKTKPLSYFCNGQINRVNLNSFDLESLFPNCIKLEKIFSNKCLKPIIPIINENRIMIIGTRKDNGEAAFFSTIYDKKRVTFFLDKYEDSNDVKKLCDDPSLVLFDDYTPVEHELEYLVTTDDNHNSLFSNLLFDEDTFDYAFNYYCRNEKQFDITRICNEEQFLDYYFDVYYNIFLCFRAFYSKLSNPQKQLEKIGKLLNNPLSFLDALDESTKQSQKIKFDSDLESSVYELMQLIHASDIKGKCISYLNGLSIAPNKITNSKKKKISSNDIISNYVEKYFDLIKGVIESPEKKEEFIVSVQNVYSIEIKQASSFTKVFSYIYYGMMHLINKYAKKTAYSFDYSNRKPEYSFNANFLNKMISPKCNELFNVKGFKDVIRDYIIRDKFDHGFESTKFAASTFELYQKIISARKKTESEWLLIDILFSISNPNKDRHFLTMYVENYQHIFSEVLYSIFVHNIFPVRFSSSSLKGFTTSLSNPFTYLALMCDELQKWNRPQSIHSALLSIKPYAQASEQYNIIVKSDAIYLFEDDSKSSQDKLKHNMDGMTHLANINSILKNGFVNRN